MQPDFPDFLETFEHHVQAQPEAISILAYEDGDQETGRYRLSELDLASTRMASALQAISPRPKAVIIASEAAFVFSIAFLACQKAGIAAIPSPAVGGSGNQSRLQSIAKTVKDAPILTNRADTIRNWLPGMEARVLDFDTLMDHAGETYERAAKHTSSIAFIQFSSGSTSSPKGLCVSRGNLAANLYQIRRGFYPEADIISVSWMPYFHDMGLIGGLVAPLYIAQPAIHIPTDRFFRKPVRWLKAISGRKNIVSGGPCSAFDICNKLIKPADLEGLDLSGWITAFCGAEPLRPAVLTRFTEKFEACGLSPTAFLPCYGLAEATLAVTAGRQRIKPIAYGEGQPKPRVSSGRPVEHIGVLIADETGRPVEGAGHILVSGPNVVSSRLIYSQNGTQETTLPLLEIDGRQYYDTGDIGLMDDGELYVFDRVNDLLIINGRNIHAADIESLAHEIARECVADHKAFDCAAFSIPGEEKEQHVLLCEMSRAGSSYEDRALIAQKLGTGILKEFGIPMKVEIVRRGQLLRTTSGKIRRYANRQKFAENGFGTAQQSEDAQAGDA